jgi:Ca2+/Na+ antiporter
MIESFCKWLENTAVSEQFASVSWVVPTVQSVHIISVSIVFASMSMLSFRLLGVSGRTRSIAATAAPVLSWLWPALAVLLLTGIVMILAEPERELLNQVFLLKMLLIAIAACVSGVFRGSLSHDPQAWDRAGRRAIAKLTGIALLALWIAIIVCGRWIAYTQ